MDWLNTIVQGVLLGGLYALFAAGLSLIFGVMRLVNIAHGDLIVLAAFLALVVTADAGHRSARVAHRRRAADGGARLRAAARPAQPHARRRLLPPLLVTFGLSIIIQNGLLEIFTADSRWLQCRRDRGREPCRSPRHLRSACCRCIQFAAAVAVIGGLQLLFYRTALGRAFRATSDDRDDRAADGHRQPPRLRARHGAVAGGRRGRRRVPRDPHQFRSGDGPARLIFAFEAVIIGGLGSLWGTLAGGIVLGVAQAIGAQIDPGWQSSPAISSSSLVLAVRPQGLFPRMRG